MDRWTAWALTSLGISGAIAAAAWASGDPVSLFFLLMIWFLRPVRTTQQSKTTSESNSVQERAG